MIFFLRKLCIWFYGSYVVGRSLGIAMVFTKVDHFPNFEVGKFRDVPVLLTKLKRTATFQVKNLSNLNYS